MPTNTNIGSLADSTADRVDWEIRPGIRFPNWSAIRAPKAEAALYARLRMHGFEKRWRGYGEMEHHLRTTILRYFAARGRAPTVEILSQQAAISARETRHLLARLRDLDLVVFDSDGDRIDGAYPFADRNTGHRVLFGDVVANAMCAIDALGAGAMCERDALIVSRCQACKVPVRIKIRARGAVLDWCGPGSAVVWSDLGYADGCGATSSCTKTEFFCCDEHLRAWRDVRHPSAVGDRLTIPEAHEVGVAIFTPYLAQAEHRIQRTRK